MDTGCSVLSRSLGTGSLGIVGDYERQRSEWHAPRSRALPASTIEAALLNLAHIAKRRRQRRYELMR
jgi:hypothetical protein